MWQSIHTGRTETMPGLTMLDGDWITFWLIEDSRFNILTFSLNNTAVITVLFWPKLNLTFDFLLKQVFLKFK